MNVFPPGTRVTMTGHYGPIHGTVVVCLCKRHVWQWDLTGRECGHEHCGFPKAPEACPWPMHVKWDHGDESHQGMDDLEPDDGEVRWEDNGPPLMRHVPERSGEGAIYSPEYLARREGNSYGTQPHIWHLNAC